MEQALTQTNSAIAPGSNTLFGRIVLLWRYRELMWMLAMRDIRARYKHSVLGAAWAVLPPVTMMLIFAFVFGSVVDVDRRVLTGNEQLPYSLFALSGLVPWTFFATGASGAVTSLIANRALVTKVYFPREVFPLSAIISAFVDFLISGVLLVLLMVYMHFASDWRMQFTPTLFLLPIAVTVQVVFMLGLSLLLSMANLFYRDVGFIFRTVVQLWMFLTCVVYHLEATKGWKRTLIQLNPMTPIIRAYRDCLFEGRSPFDWSYWLAIGVSITLCITAWYWFARREADFAEHI